MLTTDKFMSFWGFDGTASLRGIDDPSGPVLTSGTPVTVTIEPQDFQGPDWRIAVQPTPPPG